jgi:4-amino-4-deoxy-L-arabinose transferase-like glycosyltransferase
MRTNSSEGPGNRTFQIWIAGIALFNVALHLVFYNTLGFHRDELLYFSLGTHPSAGYASVPPFTGIMAWGMIHIAGSNLLSARLLPALFSGVMVLLASGITKELKGGTYARILAAVATVINPINLRGFYFFMPVFFDIFFWTLVFWTLLKWINTGKDKWLLLLGVATGIGFMNKYTVGLQIFCLAILILFTPHRNIFRNRSLYIAAGIALILFLPNIVWQIANGLPVITHMKALNESQLVHVNRINFLIDQVMIGFMSSLLILPGLLVPLFSKTFRQARYMAVTSLLVIVILLILRGKSYYTTGVMPFLICSGAVIWEKLLRSRALRIAFPVFLVLLTIPALPLGLPIWKADRLASYFEGMKRTIGFNAVLRDEDGLYHALPQDYADMLGWDELAASAAEAWKQIPDKKAAFVYCENYGEAGAITVLGRDLGLPEPVSFSESFLYWAPRDFPVEITSLVYINGEMGEDVDTLFRDIRVIGSITNPLAREYGVKVYLCREPVYSFNAFWRNRMKFVESPF